MTRPDDWESRLVRIQNANTRGAVGLCLEVHDLVVSKLVAGREKDIAFARVAIARGLASPDRLRARIAVTPLEAALRAAVESRLTVATLLS